MTILDRYILKSFLLPFCYSFFGFLGIWFIFDLSDHLQDFIQGKATFGLLKDFYAAQIPEVMVMCLPIALLLSLLYSLTAMSRSNEIISMMGAGMSLTRIIMTLVGVGIVLSGVTAYFNYESAPHAEAIRKQMLSDIKRGHARDFKLKGHLFRNRADMRTWYVGELNVPKSRLEDVQVVQQNADGDILKQWYAHFATYDPGLKRWTLTQARYSVMSPTGEVVSSETRWLMEIDGWSETPWRISSSVMNPDFLSVPELRDYLNFNSDFPPVRLAAYRTHLNYRWSLPLVCLVVVFLAAPMGVAYSRRGVFGGVAVAIGLFFLLVFLSMLFIALGKGSRLPPVVAAWGPLAAFFVIGLLLLWYRSTNRDLPKLKFPVF
ncbi:MAG: LptF/LptG family permease [Verrucomicrobiota bacterium]